MELKQPFQIATHVSANAPLRFPSIVRKKSLRITMLTSAAMIAAMGSTFQSLW